MKSRLQHGWLARLFSALVLVLTTVSGAASAEDDLSGAEITSIYLEMANGAGNYVVVDAQMDQTGVGGALFGLTGAIVSQAIVDGKDRALADRWRATADRLDISGLIKTSFQETLRNTGSIEVKDTSDNTSHELEIALKQWGLLRTNKDSAAFRAFINVNVTMRDDRGRRIWRTYPNRVGKFVSANLQEFTDEVFERELTNLAKKVGEQIAYEIIYR